MKSKSALDVVDEGRSGHPFYVVQNNPPWIPKQLRIYQVYFKGDFVQLTTLKVSISYKLILVVFFSTIAFNSN